MGRGKRHVSSGTISNSLDSKSILFNGRVGTKELAAELGKEDNHNSYIQVKEIKTYNQTYDYIKELIELAVPESRIELRKDLASKKKMIKHIDSNSDTAKKGLLFFLNNNLFQEPFFQKQDRDNQTVRQNLRSFFEASDDGLLTKVVNKGRTENLYSYDGNLYPADFLRALADSTASGKYLTGLMKFKNYELDLEELAMGGSVHIYDSSGNNKRVNEFRYDDMVSTLSTNLQSTIDMWVVDA